MVTKLFDYLHKSLEKETEVGDMEVHNLTQNSTQGHMYILCVTQIEGIMNEFQTNWSAFERIHSDIYLNQLKVNVLFTMMISLPWHSFHVLLIFPLFTGSKLPLYEASKNSRSC